MNKKIFKLIVSLVFYALLLLFLIFYLQKIDFSVVFNAKLNFVFLLTAIAIAFAIRFWGAYIWVTVLRDLGASDLGAKAELFYIYAKSWLGRYIPGSATWILGKVFFASQHGISKNKLAVSSVLEGALQVVVTLAIALAMLAFDTRLNVFPSVYRLLLVALFALLITILLPPVFNRILGLAYRIARKKPFPKEHYADSKTILKGAALYLVSGLFFGVLLFFIAKSAHPQIDLANLPYIIGIVNLTGAVSILAVFAPSGLGVREGLYLLLFGLIMPSEAALITTVLARIVSVGVDIGFFFITWLIKNHLKK